MLKSAFSISYLSGQLNKQIKKNATAKTATRRRSHFVASSDKSRRRQARKRVQSNNCDWVFIFAGCFGCGTKIR